MVKVAIAGGSGQLAREVIDSIVATQRHEILILTRKDPVDVESIPGVTWAQADYTDKTKLSNLLKGVHTVLSFVDTVADAGATGQKNLIDASVASRVKRFAPSEWATEKKVLEYTLFQPGGLLDFLVPAGSSSKHLRPIEFTIDFHNRRALVLEGQDSVFTMTTVKDLANVVARAIEYEGEWPVIGGIHGGTFRTSEIIELGAKVRGGEAFDVTALKEEDVRAGDIKSQWIPKITIPGIPAEQVDYFSKMVLTGVLLAGIHGAWAVSDEWNRLLPDYKFADAEQFLLKHWAGKP